jgi:membrane fusion protein (multidrug efflux system)
VPASAADFTVYAPETGQIADLPVKQDDVVTTGKILVKFEIASVVQELAALQLEVLEATTRLDRAKTELARKQSLFDRGMASRNDYDVSRLDQATAESLLQQARTRLELAQSADARSIVRAPFAGTVVKLWHLPGDAVVGGGADPVLRLVDPTRVQVSVQLPVAQLSRIVPGQTATVRAIAGATDEAAVVTTKLETAGPTAPTGEVRLTFTNPATLPTDTPVSVEILLDQRTSALVIPTSSIRRDAASSYVMVAGPDSRAHRRDVRTGLAARDLTQILDGLTAGEFVIVTGLTDVNEDSPIVLSQ